MTQIDKPFFVVAVLSHGTVATNSGIDHRFATLQEAINAFAKEKTEIADTYSGSLRDTTRWYICKLEVEAHVARQESHSFSLLQLPAPVLEPEPKETQAPEIPF